MKNQDAIIYISIFLILSGFVCPNFSVPAKELQTEIYIEENTTRAEATTEPTYREIKLTATAYCSCEKCCGKWARNRTKVIGASGSELIPGVSVAVDPEVFPFGTVLVIDGKEYIAQDCGGKIKGNKIDFYMSNHEDAVKFGRRTVTAYVKED